MQTRILGRTGLKVSVVGLGTWQFGGEWGKTYTADEVKGIVDTAEEVGINLIDTAECYGDHLSERLIGEALKGRAERFVIATKFGHHFHGPFSRTDAAKPAEVQAQLDRSLKALGVERIDLLQFHSLGDALFENDELWSLLRREQEKGKVHHLGLSVGSNTNARQVGRCLEYGIGSLQVIYNRLDQGPEAEVFPICLRDKIGVLSRAPLASGFLSGKYKPGATFAPDEVRGKWWTQERVDETARKVEALAAEVPKGMPMAAWALAWCLKHEAVTCVIPGCKNPDQVRMNAEAAALSV